MSEDIMLGDPHAMLHCRMMCCTDNQLWNVDMKIANILNDDDNDVNGANEMR